MTQATNIALETDKQQQNIIEILETVADPEIPVLSIVDLGIIRNIYINNDRVEVAITPTYSGCPAMDVIKINIQFALLESGYKKISIKTILSPAWTTDWMSAAGKEKLKEYGIAPPRPKQVVCFPDLFQEEEAIQCPHCMSYNTTIISKFGSTPCKALYKCDNCSESFDYFKCH